MSFSFEITQTGNASMTDDEGRPCRERRAVEVARLLRETAAQVEAGFDAGNLSDVNGNVVGSWADDEEDPEPEEDEEEEARLRDQPWLSATS